MMLESAVMKKVKQFPDSSRESVGGSEKYVEWRALVGRWSQVCLGCMHSGR